MNTILIIAAVVAVLLLAIFMYAITRSTAQRPRESVRPPRRASSMSPLPPRPFSSAPSQDSGDPSALLAAIASTEPPTAPTSHHHHHTAAASHETHATPSHDHGSSYGGDSYGGHHDGGSSYSGHDSGGSFDGGGGHGH